MFEYKVEGYYHDYRKNISLAEDLSQQMNKMAADGWRVIAILHGENTITGEIVYEREKKESSE